MTEFLPLRFARTLCLPPRLLRGEVLFVGDVDSEGTTPSGLKICVCAGSTDSPALIRRVRVAVPGVVGSPAVFRRFCTLDFELFGAGVKSSSPLPLAARSQSSSSEHSTTTRRLVAARLVGREGDTAGISGAIVLQHSFRWLLVPWWLKVNKLP